MKTDKEVLVENKDKKMQERRDFLKKSAYVAYATPFIMSMLVEKANATQSWNPGQGGGGGKNPNPPPGNGPPRRP